MDALTYQNDLLGAPLSLLSALIAGLTAILAWRNRRLILRIAQRGCGNVTFLGALSVAAVLMTVTFVFLQPIVNPWGGLDRYFARAVNIVRFGVFGDGVVPTAWFPPGYSFLLLPSVFLLGASRWAFLLTNLALLIGFAFFMRTCLERMGVARPTANLVSLAVVLYPNRLFSVLLPFSDVPFALLFGAAYLLLLLRMRQGAGIPSALGIGSLAGVATLVRSNGLAMLPALLAGTLFGPAGPPRHRLRGGMVLACTVALILLPWLVRNQLTFGTFALSFNAGVNIAIGNNPSGSSTFNGYIDSVWTEERRQEVLGVEPMTESRLDSFYREVGREYIVGHPFLFARRGLLKAGRTLAGDNYSFSALCVYTNIRSIVYAPAREIGLSSTFASVLNTLFGTGLTMIVFLNTVVYYLLLLSACIFLVRSGGISAGERWTFLLVLAGTLFLVTLTFGLSRFKEPFGITLALFLVVAASNLQPGAQETERPLRRSPERPNGIARR
jgi:hypothetical protein